MKTILFPLDTFINQIDEYVDDRLKCRKQAGEHPEVLSDIAKHYIDEIRPRLTKLTSDDLLYAVIHDMMNTIASWCKETHTADRILLRVRDERLLDIDAIKGYLLNHYTQCYNDGLIYDYDYQEAIAAIKGCDYQRVCQLSERYRQPSTLGDPGYYHHATDELRGVLDTYLARCEIYNDAWRHVISASIMDARSNLHETILDAVGHEAGWRELEYAISAKSTSLAIIDLGDHRILEYDKMMKRLR